jgi:ribose-phosphate pyrophosphokinase
VDPCRIFSGTASHKLTSAICKRLRVPVGDAVVSRFEDGEVSVRFNENIRGSDVFIVQSTNPPADHLMELLVMLDAAKRASARRVTAVLPYFGYARQDRKDQPRAPITAKLVANLITVAGADRALTMDLHSAQIQGFFDIPLDHLYAAPVLIDHFAKLDIPNLVVVAPDIEGKNAVLFDDLVTTARTLCHAANAIRDRGARDIYAGVTHGVFCPGSFERIAASPIKEVVVTDTLNHEPGSLPAQVRELSVAGLLGEAVQRIHEERSLSSLFV